VRGAHPDDVASDAPETEEVAADHRALGLTDAEYENINGTLGRPPTHAELAMFSVMWSEHCSYKSSRVHLRDLPMEAPWMIAGFGENAGVVQAGGVRIAFKMESHNHPSAI
jgi:phosphoribosylformylglycinamidine synthase